MPVPGGTKNARWPPKKKRETFEVYALLNSDLYSSPNCKKEERERSP